MAPPVSRIWDVAGDVLGAVVSRFDGPLPDRQYVSAGPPPWDCELLAVWVERTSGFGGDAAVDETSALRRHAAHAMRAGTFVVTLVRCVPTIDGDGLDQVVLPTTDEEEVASRQLYEDAQQLLNVLVQAEKAGELTSCNGIAFQEWSTLGPEGGLVAGEMRLRIGLSTGL